VERNRPDQTSEWSAGLFLTLPLFTGGQNFYDVQSARADARRAQETLRSIDNQLLLDLERAFANFQDAVGRATVQQEFLRASETRAGISRNLYSTGLLSFDDWDVIESELITTTKQSLTSLRDRLIAEAAWEEAQGKGAIP
jgi:outer membrane protein TolC